jgi:hypothetical protein
MSKFIGLGKADSGSTTRRMPRKTKVPNNGPLNHARDIK